MIRYAKLVTQGRILGRLNCALRDDMASLLSRLRANRFQAKVMKAERARLRTTL